MLGSHYIFGTNITAACLLSHKGQMSKGTTTVRIRVVSIKLSSSCLCITKIRVNVKGNGRINSPRLSGNILFVSLFIHVYNIVRYILPTRYYISSNTENCDYPRPSRLHVFPIDVKTFQVVKLCV